MRLTTGGRLIFHVMGALAEFKPSFIGERTSARMKGLPATGQAHRPSCEAHGALASGITSCYVTYYPKRDQTLRARALILTQPGGHCWVVWDHQSRDRAKLPFDISAGDRRLFCGCAVCGGPLEHLRTGAKTCSVRCRAALSRRLSGKVAPTAAGSV